MKLGDNIQSADWKNEKHVPVIEAPERVTAGVPFNVSLCVGKEIAHPNTTEHHIRWIALYFKPANGKFIYEMGRVTFDAHGEAVEGPNQGPAFTNFCGTLSVSVKESGEFVALSYCNIHGLWESSAPVTVG